MTYLAIHFCQDNTRPPEMRPLGGLDENFDRETL